MSSVFVRNTPTVKKAIIPEQKEHVTEMGKTTWSYTY